MENDNSPRVLIVDDMRVNRMILSSLLSADNISFDVAAGGQECLDLCEKNDYDLILMDHRMPEIDGVNALMQLKESFRRKGHEVPVVCHTTADAQKNIDLYKAAGFVDVLLKPIQPGQLSEILNKYLPGSASPVSEDEENEKLDRELGKLPSWLFFVPEIDLRKGLKNCDTMEGYLDSLFMFTASITDESNDIEKLFHEENYDLYTLRVHTLKSICRLIGADKLADMAADLEFAGKNGDVETIKRDTPTLLAEHRAFALVLSNLLDQEGMKRADDELPDIPQATLEDAYAAISNFAAVYDSDGINSILSSLEEFRLSEFDEKIIQNIKDILEQNDWEGLRFLLETE